MKDNKHIQKFNEHQENLNISDVMSSILNDLETLHKTYKSKYKDFPDDKYTSMYAGKMLGVEECIEVVKKYYS